LSIEWPLVIELLLLGTGTGFLAGLLGIGGGMLMVPVMTLLFTVKSFPSEQDGGRDFARDDLFHLGGVGARASSARRGALGHLLRHSDASPQDARTDAAIAACRRHGRRGQRNRRTLGHGRCRRRIHRSALHDLVQRGDSQRRGDLSRAGLSDCDCGHAQLCAERIGRCKPADRRSGTCTCRRWS